MYMVFPVLGKIDICTCDYPWGPLQQKADKRQGVCLSPVNNRVHFINSQTAIPRKQLPGSQERWHGAAGALSSQEETDRGKNDPATIKLNPVPSRKVFS
jgi:hypothetical protein